MGNVVIRGTGTQGNPGPIGQFGPITVWQANTHYDLDQPVVYPVGAEETYRSLVNHTSGSTFDPSKWQKMAARGGPGDDGNAGQSAYEVAVDNGFVGTEEEWLDSLRGPASTVPGPSAYDVAVDNGFQGNEAAWLASLHGQDGEDGDDGPAGRTIHLTTGAPSNGLGANGDIAYDPAGPTMYGPKSGGVWPAGIVLKGTQGLPGADGESTKSLLGGRVMAQAVGITTGGNIASNNMPHYSRIKIKILRGISCPRVYFASPLLQEVAGANPVIIKASIEPLNPDGSGGGTRFPVFFNGQREITVEPDGVGVASDPVGALDESPADLAWVHVTQRVPFGPTTTLAADASIGGSSISLNALPKATGLVTVNLGGASEVVQIDSYTGSGPYTATLKAGTTLTKAHASGATVGQQGWHTRTTFSDLGEISTQSSTDLTDSGTASVVGFSTTTLSVEAVVGTSELVVPAAIQGTQLSIGAEVLNVRQILGASPGPYRVQLIGTVGTFHAASSTVTSNIGAGQGLAPLAVVGDHTFGTAAPAVLGIGDSIMEGVGDTERQRSSWFTRAFDGQRPYINIAKSGESLTQFKVLSASKRRRMLFDSVEWALIEYGVNDLYTGVTAAQHEANLLELITFIKRRIPKVAVTTLTPRTSLTGGYTDWIDLAHQSITLPSGAGNERNLYNTWLKGTSANGMADAIVDIAAQVESLTEPGKWDIDALGPLTIDGVHPSLLGHKRMKNAVNLALFV